MPRPGTNALAVSLQLDRANRTDQIIGQVTDGAWVASLLADRSVYDAENEYSVFQGRYTLAIPGLADLLDGPPGTGFGFVKVNAKGTVTFTGESEATYCIPCAFECSFPSLQLPPTTGIHLYRIVQEAARNATQHAKAKSLLIQLTLDGLNLVLTVRDDGRGFNPAADSQYGLGLHIMRYRANLIGASLTIDSQPGHGTTVRCVLEEFRPDPSSPAAF